MSAEESKDVVDQQEPIADQSPVLSPISPSIDQDREAKSIDQDQEPKSIVDPIPKIDQSPEQSPRFDQKSSSSTAIAALSKIEVIFKPVGDAPILKQSKWNVPLSKTVAWVSGNIRKYLKFDKSDSLFLYVRQSFAPSLDQTMENLYNCFGGGDGKLILHYSITQAWG